MAVDRLLWLQSLPETPLQPPSLASPHMQMIKLFPLLLGTEIADLRLLVQTQTDINPLDRESRTHPQHLQQGQTAVPQQRPSITLLHAGAERFKPLLAHLSGNFGL